MCSRDASGTVGRTETARTAHAGAQSPNCNYRRDLAVSLGAVGRTTTGSRSVTCALARHRRVRARCTAWPTEARCRTRKSQIPSSKSQAPNPKNFFDLGFGVWDLGFTGEMPRAAATIRGPSDSRDTPPPPAASTLVNGPSDEGASAREPGRNRGRRAASAPVASSGRCGHRARRNPSAIVDCEH